MTWNVTCTSKMSCQLGHGINETHKSRSQSSSVRTHSTPGSSAVMIRVLYVCITIWRHVSLWYPGFFAEEPGQLMMEHQGGTWTLSPHQWRQRWWLEHLLRLLLNHSNISQQAPLKTYSEQHVHAWNLFFFFLILLQFPLMSKPSFPCKQIQMFITWEKGMQGLHSSWISMWFSFARAFR